MDLRGLLQVTRDGRESSFFEAWDRGGDLVQRERMFTGEGGVIGVAAAFAGWSVDYGALAGVAQGIRHESGGPKEA